MIGGVDMERGTVTSGGRGYYLMGPAVCLQQALIQLAMQVSNSIHFEFHKFFPSLEGDASNLRLN